MRLGILWRQSRGVYSWDDPSLYLQDLDFLVGTILSCNPPGYGIATCSQRMHAGPAEETPRAYHVTVACFASARDTHACPSS